MKDAAGHYLSIPCEIMDEDGSLVLRVLHDFDLRPFGIVATIPEGFASDGMSVPRALWRWIGPKVNAKTIGPSLVHDWLYATHFLSRAEADEWYRRALVANGYPRGKARAVWLGLRAFGWSHW